MHHAKPEAKRGRGRRGRATKSIGKVLILCFILVPLLTVPRGARAFKQEDLDRLSATKQCPFCDLVSAELPGANLSGGRLPRTRLSGANLSGANLSGAYWVDGKKCKEGSIGECKKDSGGSEKRPGGGRGSRGGSRGFPLGQ